MSALPAEVAIFAAAVADWRVRTPAPQKMKKKKKNWGFGRDSGFNSKPRYSGAGCPA